MASVKTLFHRGDVTEAPLRRDKNCKFYAISLLKLATISFFVVNALFNCKPEAAIERELSWSWKNCGKIQARQSVKARKLQHILPKKYFKETCWCVKKYFAVKFNLQKNKKITFHFQQITHIKPRGQINIYEISVGRKYRGLLIFDPARDLDKQSRKLHLVMTVHADHA